MSKTTASGHSESTNLTASAAATWNYVNKAARGVKSLPIPPKEAIKLPFILQLRCLSVCGTKDESSALMELSEALGSAADWQSRHLYLVLDVLRQCKEWESPGAGKLIDHTLEYISLRLPEADYVLTRLFDLLPKQQASSLNKRLLHQRPKGLSEAAKSGGVLLQYCLDRLPEASEIVRAFHSTWIQGHAWSETRDSLRAILELHLRDSDAYHLPQGIHSVLDPNDSTAHVLHSLIQHGTSQLDALRLRVHLASAHLEDRQLLLVSDRLLASGQYLSLGLLLQRISRRFQVADPLVLAVSRLLLEQFPWSPSQEVEPHDQCIIRSALEQFLQPTSPESEPETVLNEQSLEALSLLAELYWRTGRAHDLISVYPHLKAQVTVRDELHLHVAGVYLDQDRPEEAESALALVENQSVERGVFFGSLLARVYRRLGRHEEATNILDEVRRRSTDPQLETTLHEYPGYVLEYGTNCIIRSDWRQFSQFMANERVDSDEAPILGLQTLFDIIERNYHSNLLKARNALGTVNELASKKWFPEYSVILVPLIRGLLFAWASQGQFDLLLSWRRDTNLPPTLWARICDTHEFYLTFANCSQAIGELSENGHAPWNDIQRMLEMIGEPRQLGLVTHLLVAMRDRLSDWPLRGRTMERYALLHLASMVERRTQLVRQRSPGVDVAPLFERLENAKLASILHILDDAIMKED